MFIGIFFYALQLLLVIHVIKNGNTNGWLWLLIFAPMIGGIAYLLIIVLPEYRHVGSGVKRQLNAKFPDRLVAEKEEAYEDSPTFQNMFDLANTWYLAGRFEKAIALLEDHNEGVHKNDHKLLDLLLKCYFETENHEKVIGISTRLEELDIKKSSYSALRIISVYHHEKSDENFAEMESYFDKTLDFQVGYELVKIYNAEGRRDESVKTVEKMKRQIQKYRNLKKTMGMEWYNAARNAL